MDIRIKKIHIVIVFLSLLLVVLLFVSHRNNPPPQLANDDQAEEAAMNGVLAIYNVDYRIGLENWTSKVCAISTEDGCETFREIFAPVIWKKIQQNQTILTCKQDSIHPVSDQADKSAETRVFELDIKISGKGFASNGDQKSTVYVLVRQIESGRWKFDHILTNLETLALTKESPQ